MEIGIYTFADITPNPSSDKQFSAHQRLKDLMEEIELAEQVGLNIFAVGDHHRPDVGTLPHDKLMKSIELFGTKVAPEVKKVIGVK